MCVPDIEKHKTALEGRLNLRIGYAKTSGTWINHDVPGSEAEPPHRPSKDDQYALF